DTAEEQGLTIKTHQLYKSLGIPLIQTNARSNKGMKRIENLISQQLFETPRPFLDMDEIMPPTLIEEIGKEFNLKYPYQAFQLIRFGEDGALLDESQKKFIKQKVTESKFNVEEA